MYERVAAAHESAAFCAAGDDLSCSLDPESDSIRKAALEEHLTGAARALLAAASNYLSSDEEYRDPEYEVGSGMARPSGSGMDGGSVAYADRTLVRYTSLCNELQLPALGVDMVKPAADFFQELNKAEAQKGNHSAAQQALRNSAQFKEMAKKLQKEAEAESVKEWHGGHVAPLPLSPLFWYKRMQPNFSRKNGMF